MIKRFVMAVMFVGLLCVCSCSTKSDESGTGTTTPELHGKKTAKGKFKELKGSAKPEGPPEVGAPDAPPPE